MIKAYLRVSTEKQKEVRQLKKVIEELGAEKVYIDKISGKTRQRAELERLLEEIEPNDIILVHEISRLARSIVDLKSIVDEIVNKGATIKFIKESMTFSRGEEQDHLKDLMFNMLGSFAEFERAMIVSRVKEGVAIAKAKGKYKGRKTELCKGGKEEIRYNAIIKALDDGASIEDIRRTYKVGMGQIYRIKNEKKTENN
ncbi:recombinase family protein [Clostridium sp.]|uniref:recombinase family protein n=1 Tax=Clostridium sp. TaxID=1506 RepID=UPI003F2BF3BB